MIRKIGCLFLGICLSQMVVAQTDIPSVKEKVVSACPKIWEDIYSEINVKETMLDIWQGDWVDKAAFVSYANEFLVDATGQSLIKSYADIITILTECSAQRLHLYKVMRKSTTASIDHLMTQLDGYTMFRGAAIATGVSYEDQLEETTQTEIPEDKIENLAIGRYAVQSGTSSDNPDTQSEDEDASKYNGYAARAVDMDTDGNFANGSVTHTGITNQPYWQVDLDDMASIKEIVIYNRTDCCASRLKDFYVILSANPINKRSLLDAKALPNVTLIHVTAAVNGSYTLAITDKTEARYVRIQLAADQTVLSLAEVKIMGVWEG